MPSSQVGSKSIDLAPLFPHCAFDLVVMGASAGGIEAIRHVLQILPPTFPVPIAIVQHVAPFKSSVLAQVLGHKSRLPVNFAQHGERLRAGTVYVAKPNQHLVISPDRRFALTDLARVNYARPAVDSLFETASAAFGARLMAVVFTGMGRDGAKGASAVKARRGTVLAQDQQSAWAYSMPEATIRTGSVDLILPLRSIANALIALVAVPGGMRFIGLSCKEPLPAAA